jgi:LmbE family N-acetylglucosaminyl deacetylase
MLSLNLPRRDAAAPLSLLLLGAHADDIEIGCGGTILQLLAAQERVRITWVVFSASDQREREARVSAALFLEQARGPKEVIVHRFRDGFFPYEGARIKESFEELKKALDPDLIFTHYREDRHQDHRTINELTWNTWRRHLILEYEIPKYDGDLRTPNCYVPLARASCERKASLICEQFQSERNKAWLTEDSFMALARLRGIECAAPEGFAEAFHSRKFILGAGGG